MDQPLRFAIVGTPNVGKSSVISTLAEDDNVPVSPIPGETKVCRTYPITIDGQTLIEFIDTPGFMHPQSTLNWLQEHPGDEAIRFFRAEHSELKTFHDDNELLRPIAEGAGVIYVVDGSCPISDGNKAEMEILRLSGAPRVAIINSKEDDWQYLEKWKIVLAQHFNTTWEFNAHHACFAERVALLEALKGINQRWKPAIDQAVNALEADWDERLRKTTDLICDLLEEALCYEDKIDCNETNREEKEQELQNHFCNKITKIEHDFHEKIRSLFKHNLFKYEPPPDSALRRNLFSEEVWQVLGLSHAQLVQAAALVGGAIGAAGGALISGPLGTAIGGAIGAAGGAVSAHFGGESIARKLRPSGAWKFLWPSVGRTQLKIGPLYDLQFFFILLDRVLIFLPYVINWAHGRREPPPSNTLAVVPESYTTQWPDEWRKHAIKYFTELKHNKKRAWGANKEDVDKFQKTLMEMLEKLSNAQGNDIFSSHTPASETSLPKATVFETPVSETPVAEASSQEIPVSETPVSEISAPESPSPEATAPEVPASETSVLEASSPETTAPETFTSEVPVSENFSAETVAPETPESEASVLEASSPETTVPEIFTSEVPVSENSSAEIATSETPVSEALEQKMSAEASTPEIPDSESDKSKGRWWSWDRFTSILKTPNVENNKDK